MKEIIKIARHFLRAESRAPGGRCALVKGVKLWTCGCGSVIVTEPVNNYPHYAGSDLRQISAAALRVMRMTRGWKPR